MTPPGPAAGRYSERWRCCIPKDQREVVAPPGVLAYATCRWETYMIREILKMGDPRSCASPG
jgi:hypothetical protein